MYEEDTKNIQDLRKLSMDYMGYKDIPVSTNWIKKLIVSLAAITESRLFWYTEAQRLKEEIAMLKSNKPKYYQRIKYHENNN